jgi:nitroimidazol reductase NimA-like FMN-containing flavoprotein (pyridoxamine 5'-phosphate oxidase superfamily)
MARVQDPGASYHPDMTATPSPAPTARTTVRRLPERATYDRETVHAILDEGFVAHVGLATEDGPVVIPMMYARDGERVLVHGSAASRLLRGGARGLEMCLTVTLVDGLVLARSAFHHSANYRSVVVIGRAERIDDLDARRAALDTLVESIVPGRTADVRAPNERELRATIVLALPLDEASVKLRAGGPKDDDEDMDLPVWAGVVPLSLVASPPVPDEAVAADIPIPAYASTYRRGDHSVGHKDREL